MHDIGIVGADVYVRGSFKKLNLYVDGEIISAISEHILESEIYYDYSEMKIIPGLVDPHVHFDLNVGGLRSADGFLSGGQAASRGGVTTVIDFTDPLSDDSELDRVFDLRIEDASLCPVDYAFHLTLGNYEGNIDNLIARAKALGMGSVKVFTTYSASNRKISEKTLKMLLDMDLVTMVHAEDDTMVKEDWKCIETYEMSRPLEAELSAISHLINLLGKGQLYVAHVSSGSGALMLTEHKDVYIESCPHYFTFDTDVYKLIDGAKYLIAPPLRSKIEKEKLIANYEKIDSIGTDHCPFKLSEKLTLDDAGKIPKGIGGIEHSFLIMYNLFGYSVIEKMSANPARIFNLSGKGAICTGNFADFFVFDPNRKTIVTRQHGSTDRYSPYDGLCLDGAIIATMCRGNFVWKDGVNLDIKGRYQRSVKL